MANEETKLRSWDQTGVYCPAAIIDCGHLLKMKKIELHPHQVLMERKPFDSGYQGDVFRGTFTNASKETITVAVKTAKATETDEAVRALQNEAIRKEIDLLYEVERHANVLGLIGEMTMNNNLCMVTEYCMYHSLDTYLRDRKNSFIDERQLLARNLNSQRRRMKRRAVQQLTTSRLLVFALQIGHGMNFLHSKKVLHRDLALRNILLAEDGTVKIADFGLSRKTQKNGFYCHDTRPKLPYAWMAPEAMTDDETPLEADLWTFGILLWELFSLGDTPYAEKSPDEVKKSIENGERLKQPEYAPSEIYDVMKSLWTINHNLRPSLLNCLRVIHTELQKYSTTLAAQYKYTLKTPDTNKVRMLSEESLLPSPHTEPRPSPATYLQGIKVRQTLLLALGIVVVAAAVVATVVFAVPHLFSNGGTTNQTNLSDISAIVSPPPPAQSPARTTVAVRTSPRILSENENRVYVKDQEYILRVAKWHETEYGYPYEVWVKWEIAKKVCIEWEGSLTSILDQEENDYITTTLLLDVPDDHAMFWIGNFGSSIEVDKIQWTDGFNSSFTKWYPADENSRGGRCTALFNKYWIRRECSNKYRFICKRSSVANN